MVEKELIQYRTDIPLWEQGLMRLSFGWMQDNELPKTKFFERIGEYRKKAKESSAFYMMLVRVADPERFRETLRKSYAKHAERRREDARRNRRRVYEDLFAHADRKEKDRLRRRKREREDLNFRLRRKFRTRIFMALRRLNIQKSGKTEELLGCTIAEAKKHIESQWKPEMSWQNHGRNGWHIDHIIPCHKFDLRDPIQQRECFHYTNLQPLWAMENWLKDGRPR